MAKIITNLSGADLSFYAKGEPVVIRDRDAVEIADDDAAMLEKHPAFAGLIEDGRATITGKAGRPSKAEEAAKAKAEAEEKARLEAEAKAKAEAEAAAAANQGQ